MFLIVTTAFAAPGSGGASANPNAESQALDQAKIHSEYNDGNFDAVLAALQAFQRSNKTYSKEDSVFIAKHLAVVYSANPVTREKGKYYMNVLLELLPSAKLVDMYVSDEIDHIFEKVKEEFLDRQRSFGVDSSMISMPKRAPRNTAPGTLTQSEPRNKESKPAAITGKKSHTGAWVAAGAGIVVAGTITYLLLETPGKDPDRIYVVNQ